MNEAVFNRVNDDILKLAECLLDTKELEEAKAISSKLFGSETELKSVVTFMQHKMGNTPKRPMSYLNWELSHLPEQTRDAVRDLGDYIDHLIKHMAPEDMFLFKSRGLRRSLGQNIRNLRSRLGEGLYEYLNQYNECLYVPAKHDFQVDGYPHRFSGPETIYACFITAKLGPMICALSKNATLYASNQSYYFSGRE